MQKKIWKCTVLNGDVTNVCPGKVLPVRSSLHGTCLYICEALRDYFTFISMLEASINSRQVSVNLLSLVLGRNVEDAAVKLLPATLSPTGAIAPNEGCITGIFCIL